MHFTLILMREITPVGIKSHWFSLGARWSLLAESSSWTSKKTQVQQRSGPWWSHATHGSGILLDREKEYELIYYSGYGNGNKTKLSAKVGLWSQLYTCWLVLKFHRTHHKTQTSKRCFGQESPSASARIPRTRGIRSKGCWALCWVMFKRDYIAIHA